MKTRNERAQAKAHTNTDGERIAKTYIHHNTTVPRSHLLWSQTTPAKHYDATKTPFPLLRKSPTNQPFPRPPFSIQILSTSRVMEQCARTSLLPISGVSLRRKASIGQRRQFKTFGEYLNLIVSNKSTLFWWVITQLPAEHTIPSIHKQMGQTN